MSSPLKSRRLGGFRIFADFIESHPAEVKALMARMIVVRADYKLEWDAFEYIAICDDFEEMKAPGIAKEYQVQFRMNEDRTVTFEGWRSAA